jgi:hypothetical protein
MIMDKFDFGVSLFFGLAIVLFLVMLVTSTDSLVARTAECYTKQGILVKTSNSSVCIKADVITMTEK